MNIIESRGYHISVSGIPGIFDPAISLSSAHIAASERKRFQAVLFPLWDMMA